MSRIEDLSPATRSRLAAILDEMMAETAPKPEALAAVEAEPQEISDEAYRTADQVIKDLIEAGHPSYESERQAIACLFDEQLWNGNWEADLETSSDLPDLKFIQEDEYDQSMSDEDKPEWETMLASTQGHYIFPG